MITIVDYGMGNLGSIRNAFQRLNSTVRITSKPEALINAEKIILPGVGAFDRGMQNLENLGLLPALRTCVLNNRIPILGICLGMQLLSNSSEEGKRTGLQWIDTEAIRFRFDEYNARKIPHMGWNSINPIREDPFTAPLDPEDRFYFVHSYHISPSDTGIILGMTDYGYAFPSIIRQDNIIGIQCHPERSHRSGMKILKKFLEI
ncbi:imidazole glycerol phosphate synthase amidotransferase subunit [hydrocarbon metagenome]|uniref:Imidazole glycerol phosphate synthase amidotransferase subunit n=1 Tax=hydrocarbon metagenome TaxID=938273 RepID=A0A0W8F191_9ZZZZ